MSNIFPITVVIAIVLFVAKEILETIKKWNERKRRIRAMKLLFAEELELNHWVWKSMQTLILGIKGELPGAKFQIKESRSGAERFECIRPGRSAWGQGFPPVQDERYHKLVVDVASMDKEFYSLVSCCYKAIADLKHFRNGIYSYVDDEGDETEHREGFLSYVESGLPQVYKSMNELYKYCTGNELESCRLR